MSTAESAAPETARETAHEALVRAAARVGEAKRWEDLEKQRQKLATEKAREKKIPEHPERDVMGFHTNFSGLMYDCM